MKTLGFSVMPRIINDRSNFKLGTLSGEQRGGRSGEFYVRRGYIPPRTGTPTSFALFEYKKLIPTVFVEMYRQTRSVDTYENYMEEFGTIIQNRTFDLNEIDFSVCGTVTMTVIISRAVSFTASTTPPWLTPIFKPGPLVLKPSYTYSRGFDLALIYNQDNYIRARDEVINPRGGRKDPGHGMTVSPISFSTISSMWASCGENTRNTPTISSMSTGWNAFPFLRPRKTHPCSFGRR